MALHTHGPASAPVLTFFAPRVQNVQKCACHGCRWHPDKFSARFGHLLLPSERDAVLARVKTVSQQVTRLMATGSKSA
eukprot:354900-Chlamydomonas_euryale.AAC.3